VNLMTFEMPTIGIGQTGWLWALFGLLLIYPIARMASRSRDARWRALGQSREIGRDRWLAWTFCLALLMVALAEPRWGTPMLFEELEGHDILLLIDVSRSMNAQDATPSRLGSAVEAALSLLDVVGTNANERVGVLAFDGRGVVACPVTENLGAVADALRSLRAGSIRPGGTDLSAGLRSAMDAFERDGPSKEGGRSILLFSDGEDLAGRSMTALSELIDQGIIVHVVALGDEYQGHPIPWPGPDGSMDVVRHDGEVVLSRRDDTSLKLIAENTRGAFIPMGVATTDLGKLYRERIEPSETVERAGRSLQSRQQSRHEIFLIGSLMMATIALWPSRGRAARARRWDGIGARTAAAATLLLILLGADEPARSSFQVGERAYQRGDFEVSAEAFERARVLAPGSAIASFNAASAHFQLGDFDAATTLYSTALELTTDTFFRAKIEYALGNAAVARRDLTIALAHYDACLALADEWPGADSLRADATANRDFAEDLLQESVAATADTPPSGDGPSDGEPPPESPAATGEDDSAGQDPAGDSPHGGGTPPPASAPPRNVTGGAGGTSSDPREHPRGTPSARLQQAVEAIRDARRDALVDNAATEPLSESDSQRDW
jgi:Ca-activated chloride channel homolog